MRSSTTELGKGSDPVWSRLDRAATRLEAGAFEDYLRIKDLLPKTDAKSREQFRKLFTRYYSLNVGGLSDDFKAHFFDVLFAFDARDEGDPYTPLLLDLHKIPRRKGDRALHASFVTKLVAIHDESRPTYDRHVRDFFGVSVPRVGSVEFRIAGFVANLQHIGSQYETWSLDPRFPMLRDQLIAKQPRIKDCHAARICDLLVWTVGSLGLV